jgi:Ca2+-binding EF-hand superfamily protein
MTRKLISAAVILGTASAAFAMTNLDSDGDSMLTMEEITAAYPTFTQAQFSDADTDGDGMINKAELAAARTLGIIPADQG